MAQLELILMFICLTSIVVNIYSAIRNDKMIEQIDVEARIRRNDIKATTDKLFEIEEVITNINFTGNVVEGHALNTSLIPNLLRAFQTEKKLSRRTIDGLRTDLGNMTNLISELMEETSDVHSKVDDVVKAIHELKGTIKPNAMSTLSKLDKLAAQDNTVNKIRQLQTSGNKQYASCFELLKDGYTDNGLYDIYPNRRATPIRVYCDQATDGGGWIVFQRREDGSVNFYRAWIDYKNGFGNPEREFWMGNDYLHLLTSPCCRELRIDMEDFENNKGYVKYGKFGIGPKATNYVLSIDDYTGDAGDSLSYHNGSAFSTHDKDNEKYKDNCAVTFKGAWWYKACHKSNLNGHYYLGAHASFADGVNWKAWKGYNYSLKFTEMKLR